MNTNMKTENKTKSMEQLASPKPWKNTPGPEVQVFQNHGKNRGMKFSEAETKIPAIFGSREPFLGMCPAGSEQLTIVKLGEKTLMELTTYLEGSYIYPFN